MTSEKNSLYKYCLSRYKNDLSVKVDTITKLIAIVK